MTYKELLFKMAKLGMLTLSNDKDGRGLFWAGMNNMEALDKEFSWEDLEGDGPPEKFSYIDKQGRKQERDFKLEDLPEDTYVQRVVKEHILSLKNEK
tara:strand:- start:208 stop:498 length:291 start_codon:yes stop_codon:yes gene_type:complete